MVMVVDSQCKLHKVKNFLQVRENLERETFVVYKNHISSDLKYFGVFWSCISQQSHSLSVGDSFKKKVKDINSSVKVPSVYLGGYCIFMVDRFTKRC